MLQLSSKLYNQPILSLRTGETIGQTIQPIIDPRNLKIIGFYCKAHSQRQELILLAEDIREIFQKGFIVNDEEVLTEPADLVRLKKLLNMGFELIGLPTLTLEGKKLGKVADYSFDVASLYIIQLHIGQSIFKSLTGGHLVIERNQISEMTTKKVVIFDDVEKISEPELASA